MKSRAAAETENCNIREIEENIEPKKAAREGKEHVRGIVWLPQICTLRQDAIGATTKIVYTEEMDEANVCTSGINKRELLASAQEQRPKAKGA